jgi:glycine dehydrogenase subunit 2
MKKIAETAETDPEQIKNAPQSAPVSRLDETKAVKDMDFSFCG